MLRAAAVYNGNALSSILLQRTMRFSITILILVITIGTCCVAKLSDKRLCYDKDCSVVISTGRTTVSYNPQDPDLLRFPANTEVKVYSKSAGSRQDLWGAEVLGKRGYLPLRFVREYKVAHKDLKHVVPVETATDASVKEDTPKSETTTESVSDNIPSPAQVDESKGQVPKDEVSQSTVEDTILPHQVTPTFESIYDGTILPREVDEDEPPTPSYSSQITEDSDVTEEHEPPTPSYSSQTTEDSDVAEEQVQLNLYPKILSDTFSTISDYFSGDDGSEGESEENAEGIELASSEKTQTEETTEKTPEIVNESDESSQVFEKKPEEVSGNAAPENKDETIVDKTVPETKVEETRTDSLEQPELKETQQEKEASVEQGVNKEKEVKQEPLFTEDKKSSVEQVVDQAKENSQEQDVNEKKETNEKPIINKEKESSVKQQVIEQTEIKEKPLVTEEKDSVQHVVNKEEEIGQKQIVVEKTGPSEEPVVSAEKSIAEQPIEITQDKENGASEESSPEIAIVVKENPDVDVQTEPINNKTLDKVPVSDTENVPKEEIIYVTQNILHAEKEISESLPAQEVISSGQESAVDDNTFNIENKTNTLVSSSETVLDKQTDEVNDTLANPVSVEEPIITEVPSKQEAIQESVTPSNESFVPQEPLYQQNILSNDSISNEQTLESSENLTVPHTFVEESKPVESQQAVEKQQPVDETVVYSNNNVDIEPGFTTNKPTHLQNDSAVESVDSSFQPSDSSHENIVDIPSTPSFGEFLGNRNLLNAGKDSEEIGVDKIVIDENVHTTTPSPNDETFVSDVKQEDENVSVEENPIDRNVEKVVLPMDTCDINSDCSGDTSHQYTADANAVTSARKMAEFNSETLIIVCITAVTTLLFSLGYYFLENKRRDAFLIGKINKLEANLMRTEKECLELQDKFTSTKTKLDSIEDESFGSNEMVTSLKADLVASESVREELESQIIALEKELESTSEAGLELERMLREILSSQSEENNPLAQSIEELQTRLNDQQIANESLKAALTAQTQENENLTGDLTVSIKKIEQLQAEVTKLAGELKIAISTKNNLEETLSSKVQLLELQVKTMSEDKNTLRKQLKIKELEVKELLDVVEKFNSNNLDFEKVYEVSNIKAEAAQLLEERDELRTKISDEEGARQLLEEHVRVVTEEVAFLSEQCKAAEKEKQDAKTQLEVLKHFFEERETQRQREEKMWLEKQGEHSSTVERLQTMQNEILNYKQQIEMLKREILDQEKEYKNQIAALETKAHEHWVTARQNERRLEEVKAESSQLRNRLTLVEKNINDVDPESKMHRLQQVPASNGEPERVPLYPGGETSSSPLMFGPGGPPPPLPPYHHMFPPPPFLPPPPPPENSRPPPLGGGRLSSPPPHHPSSASNPAASPPLSPPPHLFHHLPPPHELLPPPPLPLSSSHNNWPDEPPLPPNANQFRPHGFQRPRNHKGSLHSSGDSLDKSHHSSKV